MRRSHGPALSALLLSACICLGQATSATNATPTPAQLLERWSHAVEQSGVSEKRTSVSLETITSEGGLDGSEEIWLNPDGYRKLTEEHGDRMEEVCLNQACWLKDWNGHVRELQGRDLKGEISDGLLMALLYRSRNIAGVPAEAAAEDETHRYYLLKLTPIAGVPVTIYLDKLTGLPAKAVRKEYDDDLTLEFQDWRPADGSRFPFLLTRKGGEDRPDKKIVIKSVTANTSLKPVPISKPIEIKDYRFAQGRSAMGIPFLLEEAADHIMVQVSVNGTAPIWFLVDTGADITVINKDRLTQFGLTAFGRSSITGGGNSTDYSQTKVASQKIGGVELLNQRVGVLSLRGLERLYGMPMGGLLGYDFLSRFVVQVNYDTQRMDLIDPTQFVYTGKGDQIKFVLEEGHPHVQGTISVPGAAPIPAYILIDSGAAETMNLAAPFVQQHRLMELARNKPAGQANSIPGLEKEFFAQANVRGKLSSVTLGKTTLTDIPVNMSVNKTGAYASTTFSSTLGEGILKRFNTTYNYAQNLLILSPNGATGKPFLPRKTFGATLLADGSDFRTFKVVGIRKGAPAETAGLKVGDVISAMDGKPAAELQLFQIRKSLLEEGTSHTLEITRGAEKLTIPLTVQTISIEN